MGDQQPATNGQGDAPDRPADAWGEDITAARKEDLATRQRDWAKQPADTRGVSAFAGYPLTGADVFWLSVCVLIGSNATTDDAEAVAEAKGRLWSHATDRDEDKRVGLDLSALHLEGANLERSDLRVAYLSQAHLEGARLFLASLEGSHLLAAHLEGAQLNGAELENAYLRGANLQDANLVGVYLENAKLFDAHLENARLSESHLKYTYLDGAYLQGADLGDADLQGAHLTGAHLEKANLSRAQLQGALTELSGAQLQHANLTGAHLEGTRLIGAHLQYANLTEAQLQGADLSKAELEGTILRKAMLDKTTRLNQAEMGTVRLDQVILDNVDLSVVDWYPVRRLGDETVARQCRDKQQKRVPWTERAAAYAAASRAYRLLATALQTQGMGDSASRYAERAQIMQRKRRWYECEVGAYLGSLLLAIFAGYGYRLSRVFITYAALVVGFALVYHAFGIPDDSHPSLWDYALISVTAIHGRVFFEAFGIHNPLSWVAAVESVCGIIIESIFAAVLIQRLFSR